MGWWLQVVGIALGLLGGVCTLVGFVISPEQTIITTIRVFFSQTQSIKTMPSFLGGIDNLNLDNLARLKLHIPYSLSEVNLILDVIPRTADVKTSPGVSVTDAQIYDHTRGAIFHFDTGKDKRHEIRIAGRTFVVTLLQIKRLDVAPVANPLEFVFGISEK